jgi:hypothetical protein
MVGCAQCTASVRAPVWTLAAEAVQLRGPSGLQLGVVQCKLHRAPWHSMTAGSRRSLYSGVLHVLTAGQRRGGAPLLFAWCVGQQVRPTGLPFDSACMLGHRPPACAGTSRAVMRHRATACRAGGWSVLFWWGVPHPKAGLLGQEFCCCCTAYAAHMQPGQVHAAAAQGMCDQIMGAARRPTREVAWHSPTCRPTAAMVMVQQGSCCMLSLQQCEPWPTALPGKQAGSFCARPSTPAVHVAVSTGGLPSRSL